MRLAVIPARGGSKRIPRKNIRPFRGKPMIAWSIEAARSSGLFDRVWVSTDDEEIAAVAQAWGAEVPFLRPPNLSDDHAGTTAVVAHAVRFAGERELLTDAASAVCCIYATAPLIRPADLRDGLLRLEATGSSYVFTACEYPSPIFRAFQAEEGGVRMFFPDKFAVRSQDLPKAMHDAGQFYWGRPAAWLAEDLIFAPHSTVVRLPRWRVQDIDDEDDWLRAELVHRMVEEQDGRP